MMDMHDDRVGTTKGNVAMNQDTPRPTTPVVGQDPFLVHPNIQVAGPFASGDNGVNA